MRRSAALLLGGLGALLGCMRAPISETHSPEQPMVLTFSDGDAYPTTAVFTIVASADGPTFHLDVVSVTDPGVEAMPVVQAPVTASDMRALMDAASSGGVEVPYGAGLVFSYGPNAERIFRRPESLSLTVEGPTARITIRMGETVSFDRPSAPGGPSATAELVGHLGVVCMVPSPAGAGFVMEDPTWSTPACAAIRDEYGLDVLLDLP